MGRRRTLHAAVWFFAVGIAVPGALAACGGDDAASRGDVTDTETPGRDGANPDGGDGSVVEDPLVQLIDHNLWTQIIDGDGGVFAAHRPEVIECGEAGLYSEDGLLEINTSDCNYLEVVQPSLEPVEVSDTIEASIWYGPLVAEGIAEAHLAIVIDGEVLWERQIPIPNPGGLAVATITPQRRYDAGVPILFHLHNHGLNTWTLVYIGKY